MFVQGANGAVGGYNLARSLRFRASASAYLSKNFPNARTSGKTLTYVTGSKRGKLGVYQTLFTGYDGSSSWSSDIAFTAADEILVRFGGVNSYSLITSQVFRDPSAFYFIMVVIDTTQATASSRVKVYVNGNQVTTFSTANYPPQNDDFQFLYQNNNNKIGIKWDNTGDNLDGYLTEMYVIDGQALTPSSFGSYNSTTGVWQPARYTGTYGTNGFYLPFTDNSALTTSSNVGLGKDFSGNGNYWVTNNISITSGVTYDSMTDVPTLTSATAANFAVLNPLVGGYGGVTTAANLQFSRSAAAWGTRVSTILATTGKYYFEVTGIADVLTQGIFVGVSNFITPDPGYIGQTGNSYGYYSVDGRLYTNGSNSALGATYTNGDVIGVSVDLSAGTLSFYKNNVQQGSTITGLSGSYYFGFSSYSSASAAINFGQRPFAYTPPTGFVALNAYNLPTGTILQGNKYMDATLYTGNGSTQAITNAAGFKPDLVWVKQRNGTFANYVFDSNRGVTKRIVTNTTAIEDTASGVTSFNSNGFTLGSDTGENNSGSTFVGWQWQAGQGSSSSNTSGTITSTVSVNPSSGFSIATYTGTGSNATVGHGLGVAPSLIIVKDRNTAGRDWAVWHSSFIGSQYVSLNLTNAVSANGTVWNSATPTSSVFSVGTNALTNGSTETYVAYCWSEIAGFSKFGTFTGNGSTDGTFVYCGFRPKFVLTKRTDSTGDWAVLDTSRDQYNLSTSALYPDLSNAENTGVQIDILSNGFKCRNTGNNTSGATYMFICYAENPFKYSLAR